MIFSPILRRVSQHIFSVLDVHQVVAVVGLTKEHVEAQAVGRMDAALHQLDNVTLAAPQPLRARVGARSPGTTQPMRRQIHDSPWVYAYMCASASPKTLLHA